MLRLRSYLRSCTILQNTHKDERIAFIAKAKDNNCWLESSCTKPSKMVSVCMYVETPKQPSFHFLSLL